MVKFGYIFVGHRKDFYELCKTNEIRRFMLFKTERKNENLINNEEKI